jgi:hypothetical protein
MCYSSLQLQLKDKLVAGVWTWLVKVETLGPTIPIIAPLLNPTTTVVHMEQMTTMATELPTTSVARAEVGIVLIVVVQQLATLIPVALTLR